MTFKSETILEYWRSEIHGFYKNLHPGILANRQIAQTEQWNIWLGCPGNGSPMCNYVPLLREIIAEQNCNVTLGHDIGYPKTAEVEPAELSKAFQLMILLAVSPGTAAEAMDLAACEESRQKLYIFLPIEYKDNYLARSLRERHSLLHEGLYFSFTDACTKMHVELARKVIDVLIKRRSGVKQKSIYPQIIINNDGEMRMNMGDTFEHITDSTIVNRSIVKAAFNVVNEKYGQEVADALREISKHIEAEGDAVGIELWNNFNQELAKGEHSKPLLKVIWDGICQAVPTISTLVAACARIVKLFT